ncbi:MAG TPA: hypothetical protein VGG19_15415 [Tepidisphaeraceae bacterium]|jgi:hypothetical protein
MEFEILSEISDKVIIAKGREIRELNRLRRMYGKGSWRKMKGFATIQYKSSGLIPRDELH